MSVHRVVPDPGKIEAIVTWPRPACVRAVKSFLGLASHYQHFIAGYSGVAAAKMD